MNTKYSKYGALVAIIAAIFWGFSGCCSQYIFENFAVDAAHLTSFRMLSAGTIVVLAGFAVGKRKGSDDMTAIWHDRRSVIELIIFAIFGIMLCQLSYQKAIYWTNSSTATIIQYTGPVMIMALTCAMAHRLPTKKELTAIILAMTGTFLLATHGDIHSMVITPRGLASGSASVAGLRRRGLLRYGPVLHHVPLGCGPDWPGESQPHCQPGTGGGYRHYGGMAPRRLPLHGFHRLHLHLPDRVPAAEKRILA